MHVEQAPKQGPKWATSFCLRAHITANSAAYQNVLSRGYKQVGGFAGLAEGKARDWVTSFMEDLRLTVPIPGDVPFCEHNAPICKSYRRKQKEFHIVILSIVAVLYH